MREKYINEILEYQNILDLQIEKLATSENSISEKEMVYEDINSYAYDDFYVWDENGERPWSEEEFIEYILYLEDLTGLTNTLGLVK